MTLTGADQLHYKAQDGDRMHPLKDSLRSALAFSGTAMLAFDDVGPGQDLLGGFLAAPAWLFLVPAILLSPRGVPSRLRLVMSGGLLYGLVVSLLSLFVIGSEVAGQNAVMKMASLFALLAIWAYIACGAHRLFTSSPIAIAVGLASAFVIMAGSSLIYMLGSTAIDLSYFFHGTPNVQLRTRGTRFEASSLGAGMLVVSALLLRSARGHRSSVAFLSLCVVTLVCTQSRGALAVVTVLLVTAVLLPALGSAAKHSAGLARTGAALAILIALSLDSILRSRQWAYLNLDADISDASRGIWAKTSIEAIMQYPFGMGFTAYVEWLPPVLRQTLTSVGLQYSSSDLSELLYFAQGATDVGLSPKTLPSVLMVYIGILGLIGAFWMYRRSFDHLALHASLGSYGKCLGAVVFVATTSTYYVNFVNWEFALLFGLLASSGRQVEVPEEGCDPRRHSVRGVKASNL